MQQQAKYPATKSFGRLAIPIIGGWLAMFSTGKLTANAAALATTTATLEEVVVTGKRGGPPLWRVNHGANQLWIFGLVDPLPKSLDWDNTSVKAILADSTLYLAPPGVSASVNNPFKAIGVLRRYGKLKRLPKPQQISDVLPAPAYQRLLGLARQLGLPSKSYQRLRPMYAAEAITERVWAKTKLESSERMQNKVRRLAKQQGVPIVEHQVEVDIEAALAILDDVTPQAEIKCLQTTMDALSGDLAAARLRAAAWADGDASLLKKLDYPKVRTACSAGLFTSPQALAALSQARQSWLASATQALNQHQTSFASLPMAALVRPDGMLAELQRQGFSVRGQ